MSSNDNNAEDGLISKQKLKDDYGSIVLFTSEALADFEVDREALPSLNLSDIIESTNARAVDFSEKSNSLQEELARKLAPIAFGIRVDDEEEILKVNLRLEKFLENLRQASEELLETDGGALSILTNKLKTLNETITTKNTKISELTNSLSETNSKLRNIISENDKNKRLLDSTTKKLQECSQDKTKVSQNLRRALKERESNLESQIRDLQTRTVNAEKKLANEKTNVEQLTEEIERLKKELESQVERSNALSNVNKKTNEESKQFEERADNLEEEIDDLEDRIKELETEKDNYLRDLEEKTSEVSVLKKELNTCKNTSNRRVPPTRSQTQSPETSTSNQSSTPVPQSPSITDNDLIKTLRKQVQELEEENKKLREECEAKEDEKEETEELNEELNKKVEELEDNNDTLNKKVDELEDENEQKDKEIEEKDKEIEEKEEEVEKQKQEIKKMKRSPTSPEAKPDDLWKYRKVDVDQCIPADSCGEADITNFSTKPDEISSKISFTIQNPDRNIDQIYLTLDDGEPDNQGNELSTKSSGVTYAFSPTNPEIAPFDREKYDVTIRPAMDGKTIIEFPGFDINMNIDRDEFDPKAATENNRGSIIGVKTIHKIERKSKPSNNNESKKKPEFKLLSKEKTFSRIFNKWDAPKEPITVDDTTTTTTKKSTDTEERKRPKGRSLSKENAFVNITPPTINAQGSLMLTQFQIPKLKGNEKLSDIEFELVEQGKASKVNICSLKDTQNLLLPLLFEEGEGLDASIKVLLAIFAYNSRNPDFKQNETNIKFSPENPEDIQDQLRINVFLCGNSNLNAFDLNKSYILTLLGTGSSGTKFNSVLQSRVAKTASNGKPPTSKITVTGSGTDSDPRRIIPSNFAGNTRRIAKNINK